MVTFQCENKTRFLMKCYETKTQIGTVDDWNKFIKRIKTELGDQWIVIFQLTHSF